MTKLYCDACSAEMFDVGREGALLIVKPYSNHPEAVEATDPNTKLTYDMCDKCLGRMRVILRHHSWNS